MSKIGKILSLFEDQLKLCKNCYDEVKGSKDPNEKPTAVSPLSGADRDKRTKCEGFKCQHPADYNVTFKSAHEAVDTSGLDRALTNAGIDVVELHALGAYLHVGIRSAQGVQKFKQWIVQSKQYEPNVQVQDHGDFYNVVAKVK